MISKAGRRIGPARQTYVRTVLCIHYIVIYAIILTRAHADHLDQPLSQIGDFGELIWVLTTIESIGEPVMLEETPRGIQVKGGCRIRRLVVREHGNGETRFGSSTHEARAHVGKLGVACDGIFDAESPVQDSGFDGDGAAPNSMSCMNELGKG